MTGNFSREMRAWSSMNQMTARMTHQHHLPQPQTETGWTERSGETEWTVGWMDRWVRVWWRHRWWVHRKRAFRDIGESSHERDAGYVLPKEERGFERVLLSFMKKYRETEVTWQGWKWGGEWGEWKERSQASLVSICSRRSHPYLWPHCRWQQHG